MRPNASQAALAEQLLQQDLFEDGCGQNWREKSAEVSIELPQGLNELLTFIDNQGYPVIELMKPACEGNEAIKRASIDYCLSAWIRLLSIQNQNDPDFIEPSWIRIRARRLADQSGLTILRDQFRAGRDLFQR